MAEEEIVAAASPDPPPADHHKRKLEELENAPEPTGVESDAKGVEDVEAAGDSETKAPENEDEAAETDAKRPRLEVQSDDLAADENGYEKVEALDGPDKVDVELPAENKEQLQENGHQADEGAEETLQTNEPESHDQQSEDVQLDAPDEENKPLAETGKPSEEGLESPVEASEQGPTSEAQTTSRKMDVPNDKVGVLIGKAGDTIRYLQYNSGAKIQIMRDADADPRAPTRPVELIGTLENIIKAEKLIKDVIAEADAGGSPSLVARGFSTVQAVSGEQIEIQVPNEKVGLIIGKGGETIKNLQTRSGARIQLIPQHAPEGDHSKSRTVRVTGDKKQIEIAREMIKEVMNQPVRPSPLSSGYGQPAYRPRGGPVPSQWSSRGPLPGPFPGYDYHQRGPYPSQNPPPSYGNYPSSPAPRGNFGPGWEQRPPQSMQGYPQANYGYGPPHRPEYGQPAYSQTPGQSYGHGYNDSQAVVQTPYGGGHLASHPGGYSQGGAHLNYGVADQYGKPPAYNVPPQAHQVQTYGQSRASQPGEIPYQASLTSSQPYSQNIPQQQYPYSSTGHHPYPAYGSAPMSEGYNQPQPAAVPTPGYPQQGGQVSGYGQTGVSQAPAYAQVAPAGGAYAYSSQPGYSDQSNAINPTGYGYQGQVDPAYGGTAVAATGNYGAAPTGQPGYAQATTAQPGYDQSMTTPAAGYGSAPAPANYGKSASPQPGYAQYDSSQMYNAPH